MARPYLLRALPRALADYDRVGVNKSEARPALFNGFTRVLTPINNGRCASAKLSSATARSLNRA